MTNNLGLVVSLIAISSIFLIGFIILLIILFKKKDKKKDSKPEEFEELQKTISELKDNMNKQNLDQLERSQNMKQEILLKMQDNRSEDFLKSQENINSILNVVAKLEANQSEIRESQKGILKLQDIFVNPKARGNIGEFSLETILDSIFGNHPQLFQRQYKLPNDKIADAVVKAPDPVGLVCIDSKFPLSNYSLYQNAQAEFEQAQYLKEFTSDVKKHIDDISLKYIIRNVTCDRAIMFVPSENIFIFIMNEVPNLVEYAYKKNVQITGPSTLIATIAGINALRMNIEQGKFAIQIKDSLLTLKAEFERFSDRYTTLEKEFQKVNDTFQAINITQKKISNNFSKIEQIEYHEENEEQ